MDVSQVKHDTESPFSWGPTYSGEKGDDFARHLKSEKEVEHYEPKEKVRPKERDDIDRPDDRKEQVEEDTGLYEERTADSQKDTSAVAATNNPANAQLVSATSSKSSGNANTEASSSQTVAGTKTGNTADASKVNPTASEIVNDGSKITGLERAQSQLQQNANPNAIAAVSQNAEKQALSSNDPKTAAQKASVNPAAIASAASANQAANASASTNKTAAGAKASTERQGNLNTGSSTIASQSSHDQAAQVKTENGFSAIEKMRSDEIAKMSEKDALSSQISELLAKGKGKISTVAANKTANANQGSLVSNANAMIAAGQTATPEMTPKADTAIAMVTQSAQQAEMPIIIPNGDLGGSLIMPQQPADPSVTTTPVAGGAITGIEQTSTNSISQASMASRAMAQAGSPAEQVATQITTAVKDGVDQIKVQLNPAELGRVDIKLELGHDGRILAVISADNADSLDLLQQDSKQLEKALQDAGFDTGSDSLSFSLNQGQEQEGQNNEHSQNASGSPEEMEDNMITDPAFLSDLNTDTSGLDIQV
ncbi:flagellar hook-length control protein FliK [Sneathiella glossodoripedis]|uniref:flagellar hook-length control protein FliK n=1 Tax=Sneathiella glossodoripedis TaxID=418853 RepID=UPI0004712C2E|nr:flagellar hook-length control protein FliK [Sneathiella glossodoripedis]